MDALRDLDFPWTASDFLIDRIDSKYRWLEKQAPGNVYVIQSGDDGPVKIGHAAKPSQRLTNLQISAWQELHLRAVVPSDRCGYIEKVSHTLAARHLIRGEWFDITPIQAVEYIVSACLAAGRMVKPLPEYITELRATPEPRYYRKALPDGDAERRAAKRLRLGID